MTDPITSIDITRLRELLAKVGEWPDLGPEDRSDGSFRCPLCDGQGDIDVEFVRDGRREYGNDSWFSIVGVQVYGVGDAMAAMEELLPLLIKHVPSLLDQLDAQAAEIERLRAELAVEQQCRNGHLPDCAGIDLEQMRCGCGYLDGTAYRSLADEIERLKAECIREHAREFAPFCEQSERADKADARVAGEGPARWEWVEATGG